MVLIEYRIPLPLTVDEFQVAQLFMVLKASKENTGGGEGVEWVKNEPYDNSNGTGNEVSEISGVTIPKNKGQYTLKKYHVASKVPGFLKTFVPTDSMILIEEAWNAYPHCKTVLINAYLLKEKFRVIIETMHHPDNGHTENVLNLPAKDLKERKVVNIDIAEPVPASDYIEAEDPAKFKSQKTGRGLLKPGWSKDHQPVMTCYKLVTADFKYWGFQTKVESLIDSYEFKLFKTTLRQAFCLIDEWHGLTMDDIRRMEAEVKQELEKLRQEGEIKNKLNTQV